ncbi:MAG: sirohydrochlorin cobaltochelatase [bacterium]
MNKRQGILFAAPGTTCREARTGYDLIGSAAARRYPGIEQRWAYTSAGVRRKLAAQGSPVKTPGEALSALQAEGFDQVAVVSLHLTDGMEFGELAEAVASLKRQSGNPMRIALGHALLTCEAEWRRALNVLLAGFLGKLGDRDRVILVAHGSRDPQAEKTLLRAAQLCREVDERLVLGRMIGAPSRDDVVQDCRSAGVKNAGLLPCMVVAGYSAREDIAGPGEQSWATALTRAGIETLPVVKGLGEVAGIVDIWMDAAEGLLAE